MFSAAIAVVKWIIPAYAGSTIGRRSGPGTRLDHPRIRGEHAAHGGLEYRVDGSSPHTRGARSRPEPGRSPHGIIPAYAGSTIKGLWDGIKSGDHPRIRGEHMASVRHSSSVSGSSPHTRGAHLEIPAIPRIAAVIIPVFLYPSPTPQEEADRSMVLLTLS